MTFWGCRLVWVLGGSGGSRSWSKSVEKLIQFICLLSLPCSGPLTLSVCCPEMVFRPLQTLKFFVVIAPYISAASSTPLCLLALKPSSSGSSRLSAQKVYCERWDGALGLGTVLYTKVYIVCNAVRQAVHVLVIHTAPPSWLSQIVPQLLAGLLRPLHHRPCSWRLLCNHRFVERHEVNQVVIWVTEGVGDTVGPGSCSWCGMWHTAWSLGEWGQWSMIEIQTKWYDKWNIMQQWCETWMSTALNPVLVNI